MTYVEGEISEIDPIVFETYLFTGHDTTKSAFRFAIYLIERRFNVQTKLHRQVNAVSGPVECDVTIKYLDMVFEKRQYFYMPDNMMIQVMGKTDRNPSQQKLTIVFVKD